MAGSRKKGDYSVLAEINTEEDWDNLCSREVSCLLNKISHSFELFNPSIISKIQLASAKIFTREVFV